jgi:hypothetical protein
MVSNEINNAAGEKKVDPVIFFLLGLLCFPLMYVGLYKIDEALYELNPRYGLPAEKAFHPLAAAQPGRYRLAVHGLPGPGKPEQHVGPHRAPGLSQSDSRHLDEKCMDTFL